MSNIGIMDPAFFVGKVVLLKWLNEFFAAGYAKVEETCTGAMHCQILDAIYPGKVPLGKVNFDAKSEYEYVANYKVLQSVFDSQQITKHVDVARLVKGKFQDNLEMLQWMKHFFDTHYGGQPYNAKERRDEAKAQYKKGHKHAGTGLKKPTAAAPAEGAEESAAVSASPAKPVAPKAASTAAAPKPVAAKPIATVKSTKPAPKAATSATKAANGGAEAAMLTEQLSKLTLTIEGLEKERNFYFGKLREIEILSQDDEEHPSNDSAETAEFKKKVLAILYATDENAEFQVPEEAAATTTTATSPPVTTEEEGLLGDDELAAAE